MNIKFFRNTAIILCLAILAFLLAEGGTRLYERRLLQNFPPAPDTADAYGNFDKFSRLILEYGYLQNLHGGHSVIYTPYTGTLNQPHYQWVFKNYDYQFNSLGLRAPEIANPKPAGVFRVVLLGGSTVAGGFKPSWTISHALQEKLKKSIPNTEVINAGVVGYSSINELLLLETLVLNLNPDLVIVLDGRNDLYYSAMPQLSVASADKKVLDAMLNQPSLRSILGYMAKILFQKSHFLSFAFHSVFRRRLLQVHPVNTVISEESVQNYVNNLAYIKAILETKKIKGILAFQPTLGYEKPVSPYEKTVLDYLRNEEKTNWAEKVQEAWPHTGKRVSGIPNSQDVKVFDLSKLFSRYPETLYIDSCHYTPQGCRIIGNKLSELILASFGKPESPDRRTNSK